MKTFIRPAAVGVLALVVAGACNSRDQAAAGAIDSLKPASADTMTGSAPAMGGEWSSPSTLGFVTVANKGEVELGKLGEQKATNAEVKAYAKLMTTDHSAMLDESNKLATNLSLMADTAAEEARDVADDGREAMKELTEKAAGADWDKAYMDEMIDGHKEVLEDLQEAVQKTPDAQVKTALEAAIGKVQTHLTNAQNIRAKLN
jgi:putative membrane protein